MEGRCVQTVPAYGHLAGLSCVAVTVGSIRSGAETHLASVMFHRTDATFPRAQSCADTRWSFACSGLNESHVVFFYLGDASKPGRACGERGGELDSVRSRSWSTAAEAENAAEMLFTGDDTGLLAWPATPHPVPHPGMTLIPTPLVGESRWQHPAGRMARQSAEMRNGDG